MMYDKNAFYTNLIFSHIKELETTLSSEIQMSHVILSLDMHFTVYNTLF